MALLDKWIFSACFLTVATFGGGKAFAQDDAPQEKLYNFDDMLIDGAFRDPQGMFERARADVKFEGVLKIERSFIDNIEETAQETSMRP